MKTNTKLTEDQLCFLNSVDTEVLLAALNGEIDLNLMVREQLASRGLNKQGNWVGFRNAEKIHGVFQK